METASSKGARGERGYHLEIFMISFAALLLEIAYTRVISFKLFYYYTYLVIGLALLGIGAGGVLVAVSKRLQRAGTESILMLGSLFGAISVAGGYLVVARIPIASLAIWQYGSRPSAVSLAKLIILCLALFLSFVSIGTMIATLFGRRTEGIGRLYFADLFGAGLACAVAVFFISTIGPPRTIILAGTILAVVSVVVGVRMRKTSLNTTSLNKLWVPASAVVAILLGLAVVFSSILPDVKTDDNKSPLLGSVSSHWSPIFRVDALELPDHLLLMHDGMLGSIIKKWDGRHESLADFHFEQDPRSFPFDVLGTDPDKVMIIGAAGGHEVLVSMNYDAKHIDAIELNPTTHKMVTDEFADLDGHLAQQPGVNYVNGDGRSFLARSDDAYDLIWYPAPDSYSATNASTTGAFVLSESYLYTTETIEESLDHLTDSGIMAAQFGEANFAEKPNRTTRYVATARQALENAGVKDPADHVIVSTTQMNGMGTIATVLVKKTPFTAEEVARFDASGQRVAGTQLQYAPGRPGDNLTTKVLTLPAPQLQTLLDEHPFDVGPISDDGPFFWHFARFGTVIDHITDPINVMERVGDPEDSIGERVLLLLLAISALFAAVFLLLPFVAMRKTWRVLPRKANSAFYFAALGLGFMFFEITLIQRLILFLGFPTYSLTVTLASLLIFTGCGALLSARFKDHIDRAIKWLAPAIVVLGLAYLFVLPVITSALLTTPLWVRVIVAFLVLAPLGICLGMFMPLGLGVVANLTDHSSEYVAWGWAVNGFASVIGSVLTTLIAMMVGFNVVLVLATGTYLIAIAALWRLQRPRRDDELIRLDGSGLEEDTPEEEPRTSAFAPSV